MRMNSREISQRIIEIYETQSNVSIFDGKSLQTLTFIIEKEIRRIRRVEHRAIARILKERATELENEKDSDLSKEVRDAASGVIAFYAQRLIDMQDIEISGYRKASDYDETMKDDENPEGFR